MLNVSVPINSLSFGFCGINILLELYKRGLAPNIFPIGGQIDISSYSLGEDFKLWLDSGIKKALKSYNRDDKSLRFWHINQSQESIGNQSLFTMAECDSLTEYESNILNNQDRVFVSSKYSQEVFKLYGVTKDVIYCPLGFDTLHYKKISSRVYPPDVISHGLSAKWELRKNSKKIVQAWIKKFGNNRKYVLQLHAMNPFFTPEQNNQLLMDAFQGNKPFNVNVLPLVKTQIEVNNIYNSFDIVLDGSGGEGYSLGSFNCLALGKHAVIHNCSSMKDWAEEGGAVLVEPDGKVPVYDGVFFHPNQPFNQGNFFNLNEDAFIAGIEEANEKYRLNPVNEKGLKLGEKYNWKNTVDIILENIK